MSGRYGAEVKTPFALKGERTMPSMLTILASSQPDLPFLIAEDRQATAGDFYQTCRAFAASMRSIGIRPGDAIGILMPNGCRWVAACIGAMYCGAVCVPLNTWYRESELLGAIRQTSVRMVISQREFFGTDYAAILSDVDSRLPDLSPDDDGADSQFLGTFYWELGQDLPEGFWVPEATDQLTKPLCGPDDDALYVFTSNSSAAPKAVVLRHGSLVANGYEIGKHLQVRAGDRVWFANPLFFSYGCANALPVALTHGLALCPQERFEPFAAGRFIEENRCTVFYGLSPISRGLLAADVRNKFDISSLRTGTTGFSVDDKRLVIEGLNVPGICSAYGLTEAYGHSSVSFSSDSAKVKYESQGKVLATQEIRIVDLRTGEVIPPGPASGRGEIQIRGAVTPGYLNDPEANALAFTDDGWFRTGDLGRLDHDGTVYYSGRLKEIVKVKGITVSPAECETRIVECDMVDEAYCFGWKPSGFDDEVLCCAVVLKPGQTGLPDPQGEITRWLKGRVASYKIPSVIRAIPAGSVPTTNTGKISKRLIGEGFFSRVSDADPVAPPDSNEVEPGDGW